MFEKFLCDNSTKFSNQRIRYMTEKERNDILDATSYFGSNEVSMITRLVSLRDGVNEPVCGFCGKIQTSTYNGHIKRYCGSKCYSQTAEFENNLKKVDHQKANDTRKKTMKEKYDVEFNSQRLDVKKKLGDHCSSEGFRLASRERGYKQYSHIDRIVYTPEKIAQMNQTMTAPEIAKHINSSPTFILQSLNKIGLTGKIHYHSNQESNIRTLLKDNQIEYQTNTRNIISPLELDIWIPSRNLAVEVNGIYWHSELNGKDKKYHITKTEECEKKGIRLLQFWDSEINQKWDIISSMILIRLGVYQKKIGGRECQIIKVTQQQEKNFLNRNHLQGYVPSTICFGLEYKNELISLISFGKSRFNKKIEWELLRFCNKLNTIVIGGATKLFNHKPEGSIVSYADIRYSQGNLYRELGFIESLKTSPAYYYTKDYQLLENRMKYQKHKLPKLLETFNSSLTEWENMQLNGFDRVWDCGNMVWLYNSETSIY
jgi:very-short-patch-repair endonuclease